MGLNPTSTLTKLGQIGAICSALALASGCSNMVYKVAGDGILTFGKDKIIPYLLTTNDTQIGCVSGEALTPLMLSFSTVTSEPDDLAVLIHMVGGGCASQRATELELDYIRYSRNQNVSAASDARIESKRWHTMAGKRFLAGYEALVRHYGEIGEECPSFVSEQDEMVWILGTAVALQALMADSLSSNQVNVPLNIAPKAERAAACLDTDEGNEKWWGMPKAIRAVLWGVVPGLSPDNADPWKELATARQIGEKQGVRMSHALSALAAFNAGKTQLSRQIVKEYANSVDRIAPNREFRLVDIMANDLIYSMSDRMWTEATGHRTPTAKLGTFWDEAKDKAEADVSIDDLL